MARRHRWPWLLGLLFLALAAQAQVQGQGNTSGRTGKQAIQDDSVYCQIESDGRCHCGPRRAGTGRQIPCRPGSGLPTNTGPAAPQPGQPRQAAQADMMLSDVEHCTAQWQHGLDWLSLRPSGIASRCTRVRGEIFNYMGRRYMPLRTMQDMASLVFANYGVRPILIARVDGNPNRYLVALSGTEFKPGQATQLLEDIAASVNGLDAYSLFVLSALNEYDNGRGVPRGAQLLLLGHSLGGMVAQNIAGNTQRFFKWRPVRVITLGSPKTNDLPPTVTLRMFASTFDPVVLASPISLFGLPGQTWVDSGARGKPRMAGFENHLNYPFSVDLPRYNALGD
jgi:hypothetical protein